MKNIFNVFYDMAEEFRLSFEWRRDDVRRGWMYILDGGTASFFLHDHWAADLFYCIKTAEYLPKYISQRIAEHG